MKYLLRYHLQNIPGWSTKRKIVVFESDDWGAIRMPSRSVQEQLTAEGFDLAASYYNSYDSLESNEDLERLFEVLQGFRDKEGHPPVFTALSCTANPDFKRIAESGFREYFYEPALQTLAKYGQSHDKVARLWREGIAAGLFRPEFHGREHLHVRRWLKAIGQADSRSQRAAELGFVGLSPKEAGEERASYLPAFDLDDMAELKEQQRILKEGLEWFADIFGYRARFFVAPNSRFNTGLEQELANLGIEYLTGARQQIEPLGQGQTRKNFRLTGGVNDQGQIYLVRNAFFDVGQYPRLNRVERTLQAIQAAFTWHKPAIISTHRANYIGGIDPANRDRGLKNLKHLLAEICRRWPEVEFMHSAQLGDLIKADKLATAD